MSDRTKNEIASTIDKILNDLRSLETDLHSLGSDKNIGFNSVYYSLGKIEGLLGMEGETNE